MLFRFFAFLVFTLLSNTRALRFLVTLDSFLFFFAEINIRTSLSRFVSVCFLRLSVIADNNIINASNKLTMHPSTVTNDYRVISVRSIGASACN